MYDVGSCNMGWSVTKSQENVREFHSARTAITCLSIRQIFKENIAFYQSTCTYKLTAWDQSSPVAGITIYNAIKVRNYDENGDSESQTLKSNVRRLTGAWLDSLSGRRRRWGLGGDCSSSSPGISGKSSTIFHLLPNRDSTSVQSAKNVVITTIWTNQNCATLTHVTPIGLLVTNQNL